MSTRRCYIMGKVEKLEVLTMEISDWMSITPPKQFSMGRMRMPQ